MNILRRLFARRELVDTTQAIRIKGITPDPETAAGLQRKIDAITFQPSNGFHRDVKRLWRPVIKWARSFGALTGQEENQLLTGSDDK